MRTTRSVLLGIGLTLAEGLALANPASQRPVQFDVPPQPLSSALNIFAQQSELKMIFYTDVTEGMQAQGVHGTLTPENALKTLLSSAELTYEFFDEKTVSIWAPHDRLVKAEGRILLAQSSSAEPRRSTDEATPAAQEGGREIAKSIPEILVKGSRALNTDIQRTEDDPQPYVVLSRKKIEQSGASNVEQLLATELLVNSQPLSGLVGTSRPSSRINLRGLGTNQTLILIDGRRVLSPALSGRPEQPDLNGIPLSAIERIEVLPTTASGIYGRAMAILRVGRLGTSGRTDSTTVCPRLALCRTSSQRTAARRCRAKRITMCS